MSDRTRCETVLERLQARGLISARECERLRSAIAAGHLTEPKQVLADLLQRKLVTRWQLEELNAGRKEFLLENGRYLLLQKIGQGGMGAVYRARHVRMKRDVALKIIDPARAKDVELMDRFRREAEVCARLEHEHIVRTHDVGAHDGSLFLVMEYVEGSDLTSLVRRDGPMSPREVAAIGLQMAAALAYANAQGIVHRDIKPSNTLLSTAGSCKVLDMGLARIVEDATDATITELTQDGTVMGTVDYMSPEQARDSHAVDARSDIYSLGASLYFLLTGQPPFPGGKMIEKLHRLATEQPQPLGQIRPDCRRELDAAIQKMMAKAPEERFQSAEEVVRALKPLAADRLAGRPVVTTAVQTAAETHRETFFQARAETLPGFAADASVFSSMQRRRQGVSKVWWIGGTVAVMVCVAAAIWPALSSKPEAIADRKDPVAPPPVPVAPADVRVEFPAHFANVSAIEWSPNGQWLATASADGQCRIVNPETGSFKTLYRGHHSAVRGLRWSADSLWVASIESRGVIHVWDALSGHLLRKPIDAFSEFAVASSHSVQALDFSSDKTRLVYGGYPAPGVTVYDLESEQQAWSDAVTCPVVRFSPDASLLAGSVLFGDVLVWDARSGERIFSSPPDPDRNHAIAWRKDGLLRFSTDTDLQTWDVRRNEVVEWFELPPLVTNDGPHRGIQFTPMPHRVFALNNATQLIRIDTESGDAAALPNILTAYVNLPRVSPDTRTVALCQRPADDRVVLTDIDAATPTNRSLPVFQPIPKCLGIRVLADRYLQAFLHEQRPGVNRSVIVTWDLATGKRIRGFPQIAHIDTDGRIRGVTEGRIVNFRLENGRAIAGDTIAQLDPAPLPGYRDTPAVLWSGDGRYLYSDNRFLASTEFRLWDAASGALVASVDLAHERQDEMPNQRNWTNVQYQDGRINGPFLDVGPHVSRSGDRLVLADGYGWDNLAPDRLRVWHLPQADGPRHIPTHISHEQTSGAFHSGISADGHYLAAAGMDPRKTVVFDLNSGERLAELETGIVCIPNVYSFSPDGELLLTTRQMWDWRSRKKLWECPERDHAFGYYGVNYRGAAMFDDGRHVVIAQDGQYQIWDWREDKKRATLFLMPGGDAYVFCNHETGHYTDPDVTRRYLQFASVNDDDERVWLSAYEYEKQTGWENDPSQAGLKIARE